MSSLEGLQAELAEIDENFVRTDLSAIEYGDLLLRRKEIYETLTSKSFVEDTAEKPGVGKRTVERQIQTAKNMTPKAKAIICDSGTKVTKKTP